MVTEAVEDYFASTKPSISLVQLVADARADGYKAGYAAGVGNGVQKQGILSAKVGNGIHSSLATAPQSGE